MLGIQDVDDLVSFIYLFFLKLLQSVSRLMAVNDTHRPRLWEKSKTYRDKNQVKTSCLWWYIEVLRHKTIGWTETEQYLCQPI